MNLVQDRQTDRPDRYLFISRTVLPAQAVLKLSRSTEKLLHVYIVKNE